MDLVEISLQKLKKERLKQKLKGLYLIEFDSGVKIGITNNFYRRFKEYNNPWIQPIHNIWFLFTEKGKDIEKLIKNQYFLNTIENSEYFEKNKLIQIIESIEYNKKNMQIKENLELIFSLNKDVNKMKIYIKG